MASPDKSNDELMVELHNLQQELDSLKKLYSDSVRISEQKQKDLIFDEESLLHHHSRLELAVDAVNMAWWDMDVATGNVIFTNVKQKCSVIHLNNFITIPILQPCYILMTLKGP